MGDNYTTRCAVLSFYGNTQCGLTPFLFLRLGPSLLLSPPSISVPFFTLEVNPLKSSYGDWGDAVSSLSGFWGAAPAEIESGEFTCKI